MDYIIIGQSVFTPEFIWPLLVIIGLAALIWFLSWLLFPDQSGAPISASLAGLEGLDESMAAKLRQFDISSDRDLIRLSSRGRQEVESQLGLHNGEYAKWRQQILNRWRTAYLPFHLRDVPNIYPDPELGGIYSKKPPRVDDLSKLDGVDRLTANRMYSAGIYTFEQLRLMTPEQRASFKNRFGLAGFGFDAVPLESATTATIPSAHAATVDDAAAESSTIPTSKIDEDLGRVYTAPPPHRDDLTLLEGIDPDAAGKLNAAGIYTKNQLLSLSPDQQRRLRRRFDLPHADFRAWRGSSSSVGAASFESSDLVEAGVGLSPGSTSVAESTEAVSSPQSPTDYDATASAEVKGSSLTLDPSIGKVYSNQPAHCDELSRLQGVDSEVETRLNGLGIYTFEQIRSLDSSNLANVQSQIGLENVDFRDWQRCIHAWSRGIETTPEAERTHDLGWLHGVRLPEITKGIFDGQQLVAYAEQVIYRGDDPVDWGTTTRNTQLGARVSLETRDIRSDMNYVRIRRADTRESVVTPLTKGQLFSPGPHEGNGWNGLCDSFFGGRHLGMFAQNMPNEVETKFGLGGWGFGHRYHHNDQQEWCWAGRLIPPTIFEISVGRIGQLTGTTIFRSSDPSIWNQRVNEGTDRYAKPVDTVKHPVSFLRLHRTDTGEAAIVRIERASLLRRADDTHLGWNGLNDYFAGGHHLGIYHRKAPQDVEVSFGEGGWGFGHPYGDNNRQAYGWDGHAIPETVFEISLLEQLPEYLRHELIE